MPNTVKIYGIPGSRAARCLWMARELNVPHENVPIHFSNSRQSPELLAVNPNGKIPALDDNEFKLFESMAINLYLLRKYGAGSKLAPSGLEEEALMTQWSFWAMTSLEQPLLLLLVSAFGMRQIDDARLAEARTELQRPLAVLEQHLAARDWLLGGRFSGADLNVACVLDWARMSKHDLSGTPRVADWLARCTSRPAYGG